MHVIIARKSIGTKEPANVFIKNGVIIGANNVATAVSVTERAIFAFARYAITLDANPLGDDPIKIMPAAISYGKLNNDANENPRIGIIVY